MVQPILRRVGARPSTRRWSSHAFAGATVSAFTIAMASPVSAEDGRCGLGLVLNVPDATANDIASAVCSAARARQVSGTLRIGVVQASTLAVTVARIEPNGTEQVQRIDATDANDAIKRAPNLIAWWAVAPPQPPPPSAPSATIAAQKNGAPPAAGPKPPLGPPAPADVNSGHSKVTSGHSEVTGGDIESNQRSHVPRAAGLDALEASPADPEQPPPADAAPKPQTRESLTKPRLIPGPILGVHGGVTVSQIASGVATGGGGAVGLGDEHVQGLADITYAQNEDGNTSSFRHLLLTGGARMVVGDSLLRPAFGGGWSISYFEVGKPNTKSHRDDGGLGVYGDVGLFVVPSKGHEIGAIARLNIPLYSGRSYGDLAPVQLTFLAAYVHPFK